MAESPAQRASRVVARLTHRENSLDELRFALDRELRPLIGWDVASWSTTDPATVLFTSCVLVGREEDHDLEARLFVAELGSDDPTSFAALARRRPPVAALVEATGGQLVRSTRWRDPLSELGVRDELRAAFVDGGSCWGTLAAYRMSGPPFTTQDMSVLAEVSAAVGGGLRTAMLHTAARTNPELGSPPGVVLIGEDGMVSEISTHAERWIDQIGQPGQVPAVLRSLAAAVRGAARRAAGEDLTGPVQARLARRGGGWIHLHGTLLTGSGQVAIVVEPATEIHLADVLVRAYNLTPREREVTELVVRGHSTADIAGALFISQFTVQDHLKNILNKTGVSSRRELVAALHGRHYAPSTQSGVLPSPYGWYLQQ